MDLAQHALAARAAGETDRAVALATEAMEIEREAASRLAKEQSTEPTRSILYRSAASLAYQARDYDTALRLVSEGVAGYPPPTVRQELLDLFEQINMASHLRVRGSELGSSQVQVSLAGNEVGNGFVSFPTFRSHVEAFLNMLEKAARRAVGLPFKGGDRRQLFLPIISAPRPGSFSLTVELAYKLNVNMDMFAKQDAIIEEVATGLELVDAYDFDELKRRIPDPDYYDHFITQAKRLAPDGDRITMVGITTPSKSVSFTTRAKDMTLATFVTPVPAPDQPESPEAIEAGESKAVVRIYSGIFVLADMRTEELIGLRTDDGETLQLTVRSAMNDYVRSFWGAHVRVTALEDRSTRTVQDIDSIEDSE